MIDHTGLTVSDPERSRKFYDAAFAPLGRTMLMEVPKEYVGGRVVRGYGIAPKADFWVASGEPNTPRIHIAFRADSREAVDAFHQAAIDAGGTNNGEPGIRAQYAPDYYAAFVLDPDGHNIEVVHRSAT